ncbi:MAG: type II toxin-antitoxin system death-on-curing family toxin [Clostridia bacterium]|nr:type II toxin-antitoxin system death-on-curing family toxin [Clostridia bacterium]
MTLLTEEEIIRLHGKLIKATGGADGLRDRGLLSSAVANAYGGFGDVEAYPTIEEKAARLAYALVENHAFVDGNKRIGILVMLMTLKLNHVQISYSQAELTELGLSIADGSRKYAHVLAWILEHKS